MSDQTQHMTFVERYRMQPDIAAALIEWRDASNANKSTLTATSVRRYHAATRRLAEIADGLPTAKHPSVKAATP
jgi:hypothetical protein